MSGKHDVSVPGLTANYSNSLKAPVRSECQVPVKVANPSAAIWSFHSCGRQLWLDDGSKQGCGAVR